MTIAELEVVEAEESPFLEGTTIQYAWDATSLELLKRCPRLYQYTMIDGWMSKEESIHLRYGSEVHRALYEYELLIADGIDHEEAIFHVVRELLFRMVDFWPDEDSKAGRYKNRVSLLMAVIGYLDKYKDDPAKTVMLPDNKPAAELSFRFELDWGPAFPTPHGDLNTTQPYLLCGYLDRVVEFNGGVFVMDHKTTTSTPTEWYWKQFEPNNQMTLYSFAAGILFETPAKGVIINSIQLLINGIRVTRGTTYRTERQLQEWLGDLGYWLGLAEQYSKSSYWPMNDTACDKYGGCRFREICSLSPDVRDKFLKSSFTKGERWNPLKPR